VEKKKKGGQQGGGGGKPPWFYMILGGGKEEERAGVNWRAELSARERKLYGVEERWIENRVAHLGGSLTDLNQERGRASISSDRAFHGEEEHLGG